MERVIHVTVRDKIATAPKDSLYVCGNSDYSIQFDFDEEWLEYTHKTARFNCGPEPIDVVFSGNICPVPKISNVTHFYVGAYAGDLRTTTPAYVSAKKSILCGSGSPKPPTPDVYAQIMEILNTLKVEIPPEQIDAAVYKWLEENPIDGINEEELKKAVEAALEEANESGKFKGDQGEPGPAGADGKDGSDYVLTDADKQEIAGMVNVNVDGGANIDDTTASTTTTYSSSKIDALLNEQKEAIDDKLDASSLPTAINTALEHAKESGQFDGAPGAKGDPGDDYVLTEADKEEIAGMAAEMVEVPEGGSIYTLPIASPDVLGGVKPAAKTDGMTQEIGVDEFGKLWGMPGGSGGSANVYELLMDVTIEEEVNSVSAAIEKPGIFKSFVIKADTKASEANTTVQALGLAVNVESSTYVNNLGYISESFAVNADKYVQGIYTLLEGNTIFHYGANTNPNVTYFSSIWGFEGNKFSKTEISRVCAFSQNGKSVFGVGSTVKVWGLRA